MRPGVRPSSSRGETRDDRAQHGSTRANDPSRFVAALREAARHCRRPRTPREGRKTLIEPIARHRVHIAQNGFLAGNGTTTLQLLGYPLLVDARASGAAAVVVVPTGNVTGSTSDVTFVNLLPTENVALQLDSKRLPFVLDFTGTFHVDPARARFVRFDHFHGLARMTVLRPLT
jgi:hypothetical protein